MNLEIETLVNDSQAAVSFPGPKSDESERQAIEALARILADRLRIAPPPPPPATIITVADAVAKFLADAEGRDLSPGTVYAYRRYLVDLGAAFPGVDLTTISREQVETWGRRPGWKQSTRHNALSYAVMLFKYAKHPLPIRVPAKTSAGAKCVMTQATHERLLAATRGDFHQILRLLWATGCRPAEACELTADMVDLANGVVLKDKHKTVEESGKPRVIYLNADAEAVIREQIAKYPDGGNLFRGQRGKPFYKKLWVLRFNRLQKRLNIKVSAKHYRHTFATDALAKGLPEVHVAELIGHGSTRMIAKHYGHLGSRSKVLIDAAAKVRPAG